MVYSRLIRSSNDNAPENVMACHFGYRVTSSDESGERVIDPDHFQSLESGSKLIANLLNQNA